MRYLCYYERFDSDDVYFEHRLWSKRLQQINIGELQDDSAHSLHDTTDRLPAQGTIRDVVDKRLMTGVMYSS